MSRHPRPAAEDLICRIAAVASGYLIFYHEFLQLDAILLIQYTYLCGYSLPIYSLYGYSRHIGVNSVKHPNMKLVNPIGRH